jgi:uncharacterized protein YPO0396
MQDLSLEFAADNAKTGFRLERMEVLNWGTFGSRAIWKIEPRSANSLLTGDIGSGKSTLVDALTTLLVPHQKIVYNRAAGVEARERTLRSYVRGEYKNVKNELNNLAKAEYLRDEADYTVLLACFANDGYSQKTTLAQVFWMRGDKPEKFFIVSDRELSIGEDFTNFGNDIAKLRKKLKALPHTHLFDSFTDYCTKFRATFGIKTEKALELFYQTVSIKSVGNLTEFVRKHMIEQNDAKERIDELRKNFENLTRAHDAVLKAKRQHAELAPIMKDAGEFETVSRELRGLQGCLEALPAYFAERKAGLLEEAVKDLNASTVAAEQAAAEVKTDLERLRNQESDIGAALRNNREGMRIEELDRMIKSLDSSRQEKHERSRRYDSLAASLNLAKAGTEEMFHGSQKSAGKMKSDAEKEAAELVERRDGLKIELSKETESLRQASEELTSLKKRETQIPDVNLRVREMILRDLELEEGELPFAGELIKVKEGEEAWEGAIERVLHNFGLSVLVSEELYKRVSRYVDQTNLKGRLVYYKVPKAVKAKEAVEASPSSLIGKLELKAGTPWYDWLESELCGNFDYQCCDTIEQFQREVRAITKNGQVKGGKSKHEKDDRKSIVDRRFYILGWSNQEKIRAIESELSLLSARIDELNRNVVAVEAGQKSVRDRESALHDFMQFTNFAAINWQKDAAEIEALKREKAELEKSSDQLRSLKRSLEELVRVIAAGETGKERLQEKIGKLKSESERAAEELEECRRISGTVADGERNVFFPLIETHLAKKDLTVKTVDRAREETRKKIETERSRLNEIEKKLRGTLVAKMQRYKGAFPEETGEVDASIEAIPEFRAFLKKIDEEDLPRHEQRFKDLLNEGTINDIAIFKNQLETSAKDIEDKIRQINRSLREIEYSPGTFIELIADRADDTSVRDFQIQLRNCLENMTGDDELYNEEKFGRVKLILDRFNSAAQADINWTTRVTDVRNWFSFSASERYSEDNSEKEFYSDSAGKSGGQKEKLAYTILASALAYQFGLEWKQTRSRSFRFVALDEAFGRSSDDSTRYALELFKKLDLQLLIVTPLQKINIIENYINAVHFVANEGGNNSVVRDLTIQEYREEKARYLERAETGQ